MLIDIRIGRPPEGTIAAFEIYGTPTRRSSRMTLHQLIFAWKRLRGPQVARLCRQQHSLGTEAIWVASGEQERRTVM